MIKSLNPRSTQVYVLQLEYRSKPETGRGGASDPELDEARLRSLFLRGGRILLLGGMVRTLELEAAAANNLLLDSLG